MLDFAKALLLVWPEATKEGVGVLWAHFASETGSGAYCWSWNLGNVKHLRGDGHDYVALKGVWEGVTPTEAQTLIGSGLWAVDPSPDHAHAVGPGKVSVIATGANPSTWFRAYPSLSAGMSEFVEMKRRVGGRYSGAWAFVEAGDPDGYARELGKLGYYTASPDAYAKAMVNRFAEWMASGAFELASDGSTPPPSTLPPPVASPDHVPVEIIDGLVEVTLDGVVWLVSPTVITPIGIGDAANLARELGFELPTPALADAIWRAADLRVPPHLMVRRTDGVHMDTPELATEEARVVAAYVGQRALGVDYQLLAGAFKDVVMLEGGPGLYGWHCDLDSGVKLAAMGVPTHDPTTSGEGRVIQPPFGGHALTYRDYSQSLRLCRRK